MTSVHPHLLTCSSPRLLDPSPSFTSPHLRSPHLRSPPPNLDDSTRAACSEWLGARGRRRNDRLAQLVQGHQRMDDGEKDTAAVSARAAHTLSLKHSRPNTAVQTKLSQTRLLGQGCLDKAAWTSPRDSYPRSLLRLSPITTCLSPPTSHLSTLVGSSLTS